MRVRGDELTRGDRHRAHDRVRLPGLAGTPPGQHVDVRLTAEDGYQAQRSYSIASPPDGDQVALTVERLEDGEVSTYLAGELRVGDLIELRGPIGGYFVWEPSNGGPVMLIAGGSGRGAADGDAARTAAAASDVPMRLLYSSRSWDRGDLSRRARALGADPGVEVRHTITGARRRAGPAMPAGSTARCWRRSAWPVDRRPLVFVCGPTGLVEAATAGLVELGHDPAADPDRALRADRRTTVTAR